MAKKHSPGRDYAVYLVLKTVVCIVQALPWDLALGLANFLAWAIHKIDKRHRKVAEENLRHAFPGISEPRIERIIRGVYQHFCTMVIEMIKAPRLIHRNNFEKYITYKTPEDFHRFYAMLELGRPLICLTGHLGNWELYGYAMGHFGVRLNVVARTLDNPFLDDLLNRFRTASGNRVIAKKGDYDQIQAVMEQKGILGMVGDQDAGEKGLFVDFFNRPASSFKSIALLALEYQAPILVAGIVRIQSPMIYRCINADIIYPEEYADQPDAVKAITQRYTLALERMVSEYPEQYLWLHRRWKHQPKVRKARQAA